MERELIFLRVYSPADYEMISNWHDQHRQRSSGLHFFPKELLPVAGQIAYRMQGELREDLAALWMYLSAGTPVAFLEHGITKPGLKASLAIQSLRTLEQGLTGVARLMGCILLVTHTMPGIARYLERTGWQRSIGNQVAMYKQVEEDEAI